MQQSGSIRAKRQLIHKPLTLRAAREAMGYTLDEASYNISISSDMLKGYELDPSSTPVSVAVRLCRLYGVSVDSVSFR